MTKLKISKPKFKKPKIKLTRNGSSEDGRTFSIRDLLNKNILKNSDIDKAKKEGNLDNKNDRITFNQRDAYGIRNRYDLTLTTGQRVRAPIVRGRIR